MAGIIDISKQIKLEWYKTTQDANGNNKETVYKRVSVWASVTRTGGGRTTKYGQTALENSIVFRIYFRPNLYPTRNWRIVYDGRKHTVQSVAKVDERRFNWEILAVSTGKK